jgi:hypothetical protein
MSLIDNLVSYWKLEESSGNRIDQEGLNNLTPSGSPGSTTGKIGNGAELNATTKFLSCSGSSFNPIASDFTFSGWLRLVSDLGANQGAFLCGVFNPAANQRAWGVQIQARINPAELQFRGLLSSAGTSADAIAGDAGNVFRVIDAKVFRHYVLRKIGSTASFFLDGTSLGTASIASVFSSPADFRINGTFVGGDARSIVADECGYWGRGLSNDEIAQLYNGGDGLSYDSFGGGGIIPIIRQHYAAQGAR